MKSADHNTGGSRYKLQPRFFDRALRRVKEYNMTVEYLHLNPDPQRLGAPPAGLALVELQRIRRPDFR